MAIFLVNMLAAILQSILIVFGFFILATFIIIFPSKGIYPKLINSTYAGDPLTFDVIKTQLIGSLPSETISLVGSIFT